MSRTKVLVVDDHPLFRRGVADFLAEQEDVEVVGEAGNATEALEKASALNPDVVFMDVHMPGQSGPEAVAALMRVRPEIKVVMLTISEEPESLFRAMAAGARGYVLKNAALADLIDAFHQVVQGWVIVSPVMAPMLMERMSGFPGGPSKPAADPVAARSFGLTPREVEVLKLISHARTNTQIAEELMVSEDTVKTHVRNVLGKLQARSKRELLARSAELGLVDPKKSSRS